MLPVHDLAVVPVLVGPIQALLAVLPGVLVALAGVVTGFFKPSNLKKFVLLLWSQKIAVSIIIAALGGLFFFVPDLFPHGEVSAAQGGSDWLLLRGGPERRGARLDPGTEDPVVGGINWRYVDGKTATFYASPAVVGNRIYVTSARKEVFADTGAIYSIDADLGTPVWKFAGDGYRATFSSPAVQGDRLVVGEGLHFTRDSRIYCIDIAASETKRQGVELWSFRTNSHVESSPAISGDRVVIGAGDDGIYCFALDGDGNGEAKVLWHAEHDKYPDCEASPAIYKDKVYMCLGNGGEAVVCLNLKDGSEIWRVEAPYPVFGSPTIIDDKLIVGMGTGNYIETAEQVLANTRRKLKDEGKTQAEIDEAVKNMGPAGEIWCIDLKAIDPQTQKPTVAWKYKAGRTILGAVAAADDRLYFGARDKFLYCIGTDGTEKAKWNSRSPIVTSPAVGKNHVYVVTTAGMLYALDLRKLKPVWEVDLNSTAMSSPTVARGHVFVGSDTNGFLSIGQPASEKTKPIWAGQLAGPGHSGLSSDSQLFRYSRFAWRYPKDVTEENRNKKAITIKAPAAALGSALYVGLTRAGKNGLVRFELTDDAANPILERWLAESDNPVTLSAAATEDAVFFVDGRIGDPGRKLRKLNPEDGNVTWNHDVSADATGVFVITPSEMFIADRPNTLRCFSIDQLDKAKWTMTIGAVVGSPLILDDMIVAAVSDKPALVVLDRTTGTRLARIDLANPPLTGPVLSAGNIWIATSKGLAAYDLTTAEQVYHVDCDPVKQPIACTGSRLAVVSDTGELIIVNTATGEEIAAIQKANNNFPPVLSDDAVLYQTAKGISYVKLGARRLRSRSWQNLAGLGATATSPMIVAKSNVYLATDGLGFICIKPKKQ